MKNPLSHNSLTLKTRSTNALSMFTKALNELNSINNIVSTRKQKLTDEANKINEEINELSLITQSNLEVMSKIEKIIQ